MEKNLNNTQIKISDFISSINNYDIELLKKSVNPSIVNKQIFKIFDDDKKPLWTPLTKISTLKGKREDDNRYNGKPITKSEKNDVELAKVVIDNGANIDDKDRNGNTALHYCVYYKNYELMKYLVDNGANVNIQDNNGNTPLMLAVKRSYKNFSDFLIDNFADKNIKNFNGENFFNLTIIESAKLDNEQSSERMYSEQELREAFHVGRLYQGRDGDTNFEKWFEQFKKKVVCG